MFYSIEAEQSLLGAVLYSPTIFGQLTGVVYPEDFYDTLTRKVFKAQASLDAKKTDISVISVINELQLQKVTDVPDNYVRSLLDTYRVDEEAALGFANQISEFAGIRMANAELGILTTSITGASDETTLSDIVGNLERLTTKLTQKAYKSTEIYGQNLVDEFTSMLMMTAGQTTTFTGITALDKILFDINAGELIVFGARPGVGKTALMLQCARMMIAAGKRVGFISREMRANKLMQRLVSARSGISMTEMVTAKPEAILSNPALSEAAAFFAQDGRFVVDTAEPGDIDTIVKAMRKMVYIHKVDIIFIDYLQLIEGSGKRKNENRQAEVADISRKLKTAAENLSIPVVTASQLNREVMKSVSQRPGLTHLRESGSIEQDASIVMFIYPLFGENMTEEQRELALKNSETLTVMIEIAKQRNGPVERFKVAFKRTLGVFVETELMNDTSYEHSDLPFNKEDEENYG